MLCLQVILCFLFTVFAAKDLEISTDLGKAKQSSKEAESRVDDIMNSIQGMCMEDNPDQTVMQLKEVTKSIIDDFGVYRDVVEMNKKLRTEIKWVIDESKGSKEVNRIIDLLKRDVREKCSPEFRDCTDVRKYKKTSGVYSILSGISHHSNGVKAYCDMTTDSGGWTVIQRRLDGSVNFHRGWNDYELGFGNVEGEYWLGNKLIHQLTSGAKYKLRVDLWDDNNGYKYAEYKTFLVGDSDSKYKLTIDGYSGNAGDYLVYSNGMKFSTIDQDNDQLYNYNCVVDYNRGAWWLKDCSSSGLNRKYTDKLYWNTTNFVKCVMMIKRIS